MPGNPFVFDTTEDMPLTGDRPDKPQLVDSVSGAWIAFADTGNPSHSEDSPVGTLYGRQPGDHDFGYPLPAGNKSGPRGTRGLEGVGDYSIGTAI